MTSNNLNLLNGERILFEDGPVVLTNQRLLPNPTHEHISTIIHPIYLTEVSSFRKITKGENSKLKLGVSMGLLGAMLIATEFLGLNIPSYLELFIFLVGISGIIGGTYLSLMNVIREKPKTTVLFFVPGGKNVYVTFNERDNPKADELTEIFIKAKKRLL